MDGRPDLGESTTADPNRHVRDYLAHYLGFTVPPRFAVMLSGLWGVGKTHVIKRVLAELLEDSGKSVLVSLYGLSSPREIDDAMVAALHPWTQDDGVRIAASVGKAFLKHLKIELPQLSSSEFVNRMSANVFVFDDLERCAMRVVDVFGYVNQLVERDGCKVIVLANERELEGDADYVRGKEKLIGQTLVVEPDFGAAYAAFLDAVGDEASRTLLEEENALVRSMHVQSGSDNLRLLQQAMWDFERVHRAMDDRHRANRAAMVHVLRLFLALSFEFRGGTLSADDLAHRSTRALANAMPSSDQPRSFAAARTRYPGLYLFDSTISDEVAYDVLVRGLVDADALRRSLDASAWFAAGLEPTWRTLWHASERPDAEVRAAATDLVRQFKEREVEDAGELLHVFGLMLWLSDLGFTGQDRNATFAGCKAYVDDLRTAGRLVRSPTRSKLPLDHDSHGGLGYHEKQTPEFRSIREYLAEQMDAAVSDRLPEQASFLLELVIGDQDAFARKVTRHRDGGADFAYVPVLAAADIGTFADALVGLEPMRLRTALLTLSMRYDFGLLTQQLAPERAWAEALRRALLERADGLEPFARDRVIRNVRWTLGQALDQVRQAEQQARGVH